MWNNEFSECEKCDFPAAAVGTAVPADSEPSLTALYVCHLVLFLAITNDPHSCRKNSRLQSQTAVYYHQIPHLLTTHKHPFSVEYDELGRAILFGPRQKISEITNHKIYTALIKRNPGSKLTGQHRTVLELSSSNNNHKVHRICQIRGSLSGVAVDCTWY